MQRGQPRYLLALRRAFEIVQAGIRSEFGPIGYGDRLLPARGAQCRYLYPPRAQAALCRLRESREALLKVALDYRTAAEALRRASIR